MLIPAQTAKANNAWTDLLIFVSSSNLTLISMQTRFKKPFPMCPESSL